MKIHGDHQMSFCGERRLDPEIPARLWEQLKLVRQHQRRLTLEDGTIKRPAALLSMNQFVNSFLALWWPVSRLSRPDLANLENPALRHHAGPKHARQKTP